MSSSVVFLKCYFCQKVFNKSSLIDINQSSVMISDESLEIKHLIFETCLIKIDVSTTNFICVGCNNSLVSFHMFKREAKKYTSFESYIKILDVLIKLEKFLETITDIDNIRIIEDPAKWTVTYENDFVDYEYEDIELEEYSSEDKSSDVLQKMEDIIQQNLLHELAKCKINLLTDNEKVVSYWKCQWCHEEKTFKTEHHFKTHLKTSHENELKGKVSNEIFTKNWLCIECREIFESIDCLKLHTINVHKSTASEVSHIFQSEVTETSTVESECDSSKPKRRKLNTLNDLQSDQLEWIREKVSKSEIVKGKKRYYKCSECKVTLCTQASLVRHLRDIHLLKDPTDEKSILKDTLIKSKMTLVTENGEEIVWKCLQCERERIYKSEQSFKVHYRMNHIRDTVIDSKLISNCKFVIKDNNGDVKEVWKCPQCSKTFKHRDGLRNHLKSVHSGSLNDLSVTEEKSIDEENTQYARGSNACEECGVKFQATKHHIQPRIHSECHEVFKVLAPIIPHYKCDKCRSIFNSKNSLELHLSIHDDPESINSFIEVDGLLTFGASYLKDPVGDADEACLDEVQTWKCGHCSVRYFEENDCVSHQLLLHTVTLSCHIDNREFSGFGLSKFLQHTKNKHPELFPNITYPCSTCKMEFPTIYKKLAHQKLCSQKRFECDYCSKRYSTKQQLQSHMLFELGIAGFSCENCGKKCKTMSDLRIHENTHTGLRPYSCSVCAQTFKTPSARSSHMETHNEDGFSCKICGTKFTNRTLYQRHKRYQHDEEFRKRQFEKNSCSICGKAFLRTYHYKEHIKQHH